MNGLLRRCGLRLLLAIAALGISAGNASAYFSSTGGGTIGAPIASLTAPVHPQASVVGTDVDVTWTASTIGGTVAAGSYTVERYDGSGADLGEASCGPVPSSAGIPGALGGFSCTDTPPAGTFEYKITAHYRTWATSTGFTGSVQVGVTATSVVSSLNPARPEQQVTYTATVTVEPPGTPTGKVRFLDGASAISGCEEQTLTIGSPYRATCNVTYPGVGSHSITARYLGDNLYPGSSSSALTQTIAKGSQSIAFEGLPASKRLDEGPITVKATASSGLPVTFESKTTGVCTTSGTSGETVTFHTAGTCTIKASQAGDGEWVATTEEQSVAIAKGNQTIAFTEPPSRNFGEGSTTVAATASSGLPVSFNSKTASVCTTSGTLGEIVTFHSTGTCTVEAAEAGDSNWNAATPVEQSFTIAKGNQTITFKGPTEKRLDQSPTTVEATASSGLPVSFDSVTTGICTASGETVTFHATGTCTIEATQTGDSNWNAATPVSQSFIVAKGNQAITFAKPPAASFSEGSTTVEATATSGLTVSFESKTTGICTTSGTTGETITFLAAGTCTIKATQPGNTNWNTATPVEQSFTIAKSNQTIAFAEPPGKSFSEGSTTVAATASSGLAVTFESKTTGICTVSGASGEKVTFGTTGTCTIKATQPGDSNWNAATPVEQSFTIAKGNQTITFKGPTEKRLDQSPITIEATASSGLPVSFGSKTTSVCTTSGTSGETITFHATGTCTIKAVQAGDSNWNAATPVEQSFTIAKGNQTITFEGLPASKRLDEGPITVKATASSGLPVTLESKTTGVCTTSGTSGETITFHTAGTCTIKASQAGSSEWNATAEEQSLTVAKGNQAITFAKPPAASFSEGSTTVEATATSGLTVSFESKTTGICTTSGTTGETITFLAAGTCTIKATQPGNTNWNTATPIEQSFTIAKSNQTITFKGPAEKRLDQSPITVTATASSGLPVSFESKTASVCTTSGTTGETVTLHTTGTCTIKATQTGNANWNAATPVEQSFTIAKGNQTITFKGPTEKRLDQSPITVTATASSGLPVTFESKTTGICTIVGETVTFHTTGTCTIEATQTGSANWNAATPVEQSFTIAKGNQTITFKGPTEKRLDQSPITIEATASSGLPVSFESKTTSVCTTSGTSGETITFHATGTCTIKAVQAGDSNWNAATPVEQSFTIAKGNQTITFEGLPASKRLDEGPITVKATASSGLPVTLESKTTGVCTTSGTSGETITFHTAGTCTIKASQAGSSEWNATAEEQSLTVAKGNQAITFAKPPAASFSEGSTTVEATATSGLTVSFESKTTGICTTSGTTGETITFLAAGTCTIKATQPGNTNWNTATPIEQSFTIAKSNQTITFKGPAEKRLDQSPITVTATASSGLPVSFESKTASVCTTSGTTGETVTLHTTGTCTIKATQTGNANWNAATPVEQSFTIAKGNQTITFKGPTEKRLDQSPITVTATASSGLPVTFESKTTGICTIVGETVTFHTTGTCTIEATQTGSANWNAATPVEQSFTIAKGNQTITFNELSGKSFGEGSTTVAATASSGLAVTFGSKTTGICTVSGASGEKVTFVTTGTCTIKATQSGSANWNAATPVEQSFAITSTAATLTALSPATVGAGEGTSRVAVSPDGKNVYATNRGGGGNTVSQYSRNTETGKLTALAQATVATETEPEGIVVSPDGNNVYVANRGSNTISRYSRNLATGALTAQTTVSTGEGPIGLAITPDGKQVYAANATSATISQFSRNTGTGELKALAKATVAAGTNAHGIVVSPDGKNVYVANYGANTVSEYALSEVSGELTALGTVAAGTNPHDLAISPDGASVYVADSTTPGEVLEMARDTETGTLASQTTIASGEFTECIVVSPDGNSVYATNEVTDNVSQYSRDTETGALTALTPATVATGTHPEGIAVSADSNSVYIANHGSGSVSQYSR